MRAVAINRRKHITHTRLMALFQNYFSSASEVTTLWRYTNLFIIIITTEVSRYQKGKTNLDFTETRDSEWKWHQLGHMQV